MPDIDIWGVNVYRGLGFGDLFDEWAARSCKPSGVSEYGADAWSANTGAVDAESQAEAVRPLTQLIWDNGSARTAAGRTRGAVLFSDACTSSARSSSRSSTASSACSSGGGSGRHSRDTER
ncbi:hypothetical protein WME99_42755 [Sorangium sp. So ce136]|uniref:hypothetical protein n=1 Tax=Sorangium sp. So ce136 TaxID=3133284 RepID=UPI003F04CB57